jgi:hypothetical protein
MSSSQRKAQRLPMPSSISRRFDIIVSMDCEFVVPQGDAAATTPNTLLSFQLSWLVTRGAAAAEAPGTAFWYPPTPGARPTLEELLALTPWHKRVLLVSHNGLAEVAHFRRGATDADPPQLPKVSAVGKVPITFAWHHTADGQIVQVRDTMLLAAEGAKALSILSETNEVYRKVDLEALVHARAPHLLDLLAGASAISRMDLVLEHARSVYETYAMHDALATLEYWLRFQAAGQTDYNVDKPVMTAVGLSQAAFIAAVPQYQRLWGVEQVTLPDEWGRVRTQAKVGAGRAASEELATACYKGGLNTAYQLGHTSAACIVDVDMVGAYASSMAMLREIQWDTATPTKSLRAVQAAIDRGCYVYAQVAFAYPQRARHRQTHLADRVGGAGLIYCLRGTCFATGVEIAAARALGAHVEVLRAVYYETSATQPFAEYLAGVAQRRIAAKAAGNKHGDLLAKLVGNGLYGKLGQGLGVRRTAKVRDDDESTPIRKSSLTSPQYAAYCTAVVRCALADLVNCAQDIGATPLCATTDGVMVALRADQSFADLQLAYNTTPNGALLLAGRVALRDAKPQSLVVKATGTTALVCRTRVNSLWDADGKAVTGAWTGWRGADRSPATRAAQQAAAFDAADMALVQYQARLPSPFQVIARRAEYRPTVQQLTLRVDSDHKRNLRANGTSTTWTDVEAYAANRKLAEHLHKHGHAATYNNLTRWPRAVPPPRPKRTAGGASP